MVNAISFGGKWLDTDDQTKVQLQWTNNIIEQGEPKLVYTLDLSVPATPKNCSYVGYSESEQFGGIRSMYEGLISIDGCIIKGKMGITSTGKGRVNLLFTFGVSNTLGFTDSIATLMEQYGDTINFRGKDESIPYSTQSFGWVSYHNGAHQDGLAGAGNTPSVMPVANLGYIIKQSALTLGYTVYVDGVEISNMSTTDPLSPYFYMFTLPSCNAEAAEYAVLVDDFYADLTQPSPTIAVSGAGTTLAQAGLELDENSGTAPKFLCGIFHNSPDRGKKVRVFRPLRPLKIKFPDRSNNAVRAAVTGFRGYEFYGCTTDAGKPDTRELIQEFPARYSDSFTLTNIDQFGTLILGLMRWRENAYAHICCSGGYTFNVYHEGDVAQTSDDIILWQNLPDMTFMETLMLFCKLVVGGVKVDEANMRIDIVTFEGVVASAATTRALIDNPVLTERGGIVRHLEGWARHNRIDGSDDATNEMRWVRDYPVTSDMIEEERNIATIDFRTGNYGDNYEFQCQDITIDTENNERNYTGQMHIMCVDPNGGNPLHLNYVDCEEGIAEKFQIFTKESDEVTVSIRLSLVDFMSLEMGSTAALFGRSWLIRSATWSDGVAELKLLSINFADMQ